MATAFTEHEMQTISLQLKKAARAFATTLGMRKTTVEQLAEAAGISKGAFYKFYESKELLFFELVEDIHTELYQDATEVLNECKNCSDSERAAKAILRVCQEMAQSDILSFIENDVPYMLRKIPEDVLKEHYHSDEVHIKELIEKNGLQPIGGSALATQTVRGLILTVSHRSQIGDLYPKVLEIMVSGVCEKLFSKK